VTQTSLQEVQTTSVRGTLVRRAAVNRAPGLSRAWDASNQPRHLLLRPSDVPAPTGTPRGSAEVFQKRKSPPGAAVKSRCGGMTCNFALMPSCPIAACPVDPAWLSELNLLELFAEVSDPRSRRGCATG
jgi:hypothetical protein